jgi:hypothetical protein
MTIALRENSQSIEIETMERHYERILNFFEKRCDPG